jgi:hypothetical protein
MTVTLEEMLAEESVESRERILQLADEMRSELTLREMRRLRKISQASLAKKLKIGQEGVSRIERRQDMNISTLVSYIEGIGGKLSFVVDMPGYPPFVMAGLGSRIDKRRSSKKPGSGAKSKAESGSVV